MYLSLRVLGFLLGGMILGSTWRAHAVETVTGLDISLESLDTGYFDRPYRARGMVFEVVGIAALQPAGRAEVRARLGGKWMTFTTDESGAFQIDLVIPEESKFNFEKERRAQLQIDVRKGRFKRTYAFPVTLGSPLKATVRCDRRIYEPNETVHFWSRIDDALTGRPLGGIPVTIAADGRKPQKRVTSASGVVAVDLKLEGGEMSSEHLVSIEAFGRVLGSTSYTVDKRATTDLLITVKASPEAVGPGEPFTISVEVRSVRGTPMRGAEVALEVSQQQLKGKTDASGNATFHLKAPAFASGDDGIVRIEGSARHEGCRAMEFSGSFRVRPPSSLKIDVLVPHGALVPKIDETLIVSVETEEGHPVEAGTVVELRGTAFKNNRARVTVDRHGLAAVPIRLSRERYAMHVEGDCSGYPSMTIEAQAGLCDSTSTKTEICIPVSEETLVVPKVDKPAIGPGEPFTVTVKRHPEVAASPVTVAFRCGDQGFSETAIVTPSSDSVRFHAPRERLGVCMVSARPLRDVNHFPTFGLGSFEPVLVRPATPTFPTLSVDRERYAVKERARLAIHTPPGEPKSFAAVLVRDLARHQGEAPFDEYFMNRELEQAVLDPATPEAELLIRAALISYGELDENVGAEEGDELPGPPMEYDAPRNAHSLRTEVAGSWMVAVEKFLAQSVENAALEDIALDSGETSRFRDDAVDRALKVFEEDEAVTLGEGRVTARMLTDLDSSFTFENAAKRVARRRLVRLLSAISFQLNPKENDETRSLGFAGVPPERLLSDMVRRGVLKTSDLRDPWGNTFVFQKTGRKPRWVFSSAFEAFELLSPGPDGRVGTDDDIRDPKERAIPKGTLYAIASGEDRLMAALSAISPGAGAFEKLLAAYDRLNDEAIEELIGDGLLGHGKGVGGGSGYGRGYSRLGGRRASVPSIRSGSAMVLGRALASVLREDFPATLYFTADALVSSSGTTTLEIPLAHAATTYVAEAIVWREDGWRWSASTEIHVDQDLLVDAPLPERATVGDELILPIRLSNRTDTARAVSVQVTGTDSLGIIPVTIEAVQIPPLDTIELPFPITFTKAAMGKVTIAAVDDRNRPVDAVRRRIDIQPGLRKAKTEVGEILRGRGTLTVDAPKGADLTVHLTVGSSLFAGYETVSWTEWLNSLVGRPVHTTDERDDYDLFAFEDDEDRGVRAMLIGAKWSDREIPDSAVSRVIARLFDEVNKESKERANDVRFSSRLLMLLAPAYLHRDKRPALSAPLAKLIRALRVDVENGAAQFADAPWLCARAAAALLWTAPKKKAGKRAAELLRRARESVVRIDGELWFEGGRDDSFALESELFGVSALFALAEFRAGNEGFAFELIRGMAKRAHFESEGMTGADDLEVEDRIMAQAAAALLTGERPESSFKLLIDGHRYDVELEEGYGNIEPSAFEHGGTHAVEIKDAGSRPILVEAKAKYQADWNTPPKHVGPFALRLDGEAGRADGRSGFELSVRNRNPRVISEPVVEIYLPAGAEVDEEARERLTELTGFQPSVSSDTLTLRLRPMRPREERIISLPWLWTVGGRMTGIGITAWAADRPEAICVLPAKKIEVQRRASTIGGNP